MVRKKSKILMIILIFIMIFNFSYPTVYATGTGNPTSGTTQSSGSSTGTTTSSGTGSTSSSGSSNPDWGTAVDFGLGLLINPIIMLAYWIGDGLLLLTNAMGAKEGETVTPETILFNKLELTNINFFDSSNGSSFGAQLQENIASWYYVMRTIAIIASLCVLIYIAIRMATSTIASDKAEYKRMLIDWAVGFILIFILHYIIILVINGNNLIVNTLSKTIETSSSGELTSFINTVKEQVKWAQAVSKTLTATFIFIILVAITLAFLLMYIKRMIVVAFLIIIAPLITITYAIDKVGDSKSQALDSWLKEFVWTVLIQPFHCVIYIVFASVVIDSLDANNLSSSILAIMCLIFILQAEDIVKKIFGIQADNIGKMSSSFAMAAGGALAASRFAGKGAAKGAGAVSKGAGKVATAVANKLPKTQDGKGIGTGPTNDNSNSFSQKVANATGKVQNKLQGFNNFMENNKFAKAATKFGKAYVDYGYKAATTLVGTALATPTANGISNVIEGGMAGYAAGQAVKAGAKWIGKKATVDVVESGRTRNAERNLNESYKQMQQQDGLSNEKMFDRARNLIKLDLNSEKAKNLSEAQLLFAHNLQVMKHQLEKAGEDTSIDNVMSRINLKDINSSNSTDNNSSTDNNNNSSNSGGNN